jgi:hypothetical protein
MKEPVYFVNRVPPMGGLALMALRLTEQRTGYGPFVGEFENPATFLEPRKHLDRFPEDWLQFSREYYSIIDRIARGAKP